jgi:hypothetical protein
MLASIVLFAVVAGTLARNPQRPLIILYEAITTVTVMDVIAWLILRRKFLGEAAHLLANDPSSIPGLGRWQIGHIVGYALSEAVALFGFNLRFMGFSFREVTPFFLAGFVLMLFSAPKSIAESR